jgi:TrmH family RNA methyltransferase
MRLSKTRFQQIRKRVKSLQLKKYRKEEGCFLVEGAKSVRELLDADFEVEMLLGTSEFLNSLPGSRGEERLVISAADLESIGSFQTNDAAIAITRIKPNAPPSIDPGEFALVLDGLGDPGNLGTIIRTADWYGIRNVIASEETADMYNPKVIAATMGSFCRVSVYYTDLSDFLRGKQCIYGAFMDGRDVRETEFKDGGFLVIGNESHGISAKVGALVTDRITIPRYGKAESLNAAIATAILLDNLRRTQV